MRVETAMTLDQFHDLKLWHQRHLREHPVEKHVWDVVLTLWLIGWVGAPVAFLIHARLGRDRRASRWSSCPAPTSRCARRLHRAAHPALRLDFALR